MKLDGVKAIGSSENRSGIGTILGLLFVAGFALISAAVIPGLRTEALNIYRSGLKYYSTRFGLQDSPNSKPLEIQPLTPAAGPLQVDSSNPRYFTDGSGRAILLVGSHTWDNRQDLGAGAFNWARYLDDLQSWGHNFIRLWIWEEPSPPNGSPNLVNTTTTLTPEIWMRTGPGLANDGGLKFDLTKYNQNHFDRLRQRVIEAGNRGIFVSIMMFDGWSVAQKSGEADPWPNHPFMTGNNINGINGDPNSDGNGYETENLSNSNITALQEAYVRKVIDTVNDLDNVLYEISNEPDATVPGTVNWINHIVNYIHAYEATRLKQHPVWFTVPYPGGDNRVLLNSNAEAISPNSDVASDGSKVIIVDTDHYFGIGGDADWAWKKFCLGYNIVYMDSWDNEFLDASNLGHPDQNLRDNLGWIRYFSNRMNLEAMIPHGELASSRYALANPVTSGAEYLVYIPSGGSVTVDLSDASGTLNIEWFNPNYGTTTNGGTTTGGANHSFSAPFNGDAVLYLYQTANDTTPPEISNVRTYKLDNFARIAWITDEPSTSQVIYGVSPNLDLSTPEVIQFVTTHAVPLTGLSPNTTYSFSVKSKDASGNLAISEGFTFKTLTVEEVRRIYLPLSTKR